MKKLISQGAEAKIYLTDEPSINFNGKKQLAKKFILKDRVSKSYRLKQLDERLRKKRTEKEFKILEKASKKIRVPRVFSNKDYAIQMEFIEGERLSENLNKYKKEKQKEIVKKIGKEIAQLHEADIIHGDLTTSNALLKNQDIFIIDFGLSFISKRVEDKAVDLHLFSQALEAKHFENFNILLKAFLDSYKKASPNSEKVLAQLEKVELRGRYKAQT